MTQVTLKQDGKTLTALLSGEIDHHGAAILREKIDERAAAAAPAILILDFSAVTFMPKDIKRMLSIAGIESKD